MKCLSCVGEFMMASRKAQANGEVPELPEIRDAITMAPSWQTKTTMGQMVMACVAVPTCMQHLGAQEKSALEKAADNGLFLGGGQ